MMRANPGIPLHGDHNECPGCGLLFNSTHAFDKHRVGPHGARRCLTPEEMMAKGMVQRGIWWISERNRSWQPST